MEVRGDKRLDWILKSGSSSETASSATLSSEIYNKNNYFYNSLNTYVESEPDT